MNSKRSFQQILEADEINKSCIASFSQCLTFFIITRLTALQELAFQGIPDDSGLRGVAWKVAPSPPCQEVLLLQPVTSCFPPHLGFTRLPPVSPLRVACRVDVESICLPRLCQGADHQSVPRTVPRKGAIFVPMRTFPFALIRSPLRP